MIRILNITSFLALILLCASLAASESGTLHAFSYPSLVQITSVPNNTNITSKSNFSAYQFTFSTLGAPIFSFAALQKENDTAAAFSFRVAILALVEYNDTIAVENSTSAVFFPNYIMQWSKITENDQNPGIKEFDTNLQIKNQSGNTMNVSISAFISSNTTTFQDTVLSPTKLKYTLSFTNFPYQYQNSKVAIIKAVYAESDTLSLNSQTTFTIAPQNLTNSTVGDFSWSPQLLADGKNASITVTNNVIWQGSQNLTHKDPFNQDSGNATNSVFAQANETLVLLAFKFNVVQPKSVIWDPSIGLATESDLTGTNSNGTNSNGTNSPNGSNQTNDGYKIVYQTSFVSYIVLGAIMIIFF